MPPSSSGRATSDLKVVGNTAWSWWLLPWISGGSNCEAANTEPETGDATSIGAARGCTAAYCGRAPQITARSGAHARGDSRCRQGAAGEYAHGQRWWSDGHP